MKKIILLLACAFWAWTLSLMLAGDAAAQNTASPHVRNHIKLQNSLSYDARMKSNRGFTVDSAKGALASAKEKAKERRRRERDAKKRDAIYAKIERLRNE